MPGARANVPSCSANAYLLALPTRVNMPIMGSISEKMCGTLCRVQDKKSAYNKANMLEISLTQSHSKETRPSHGHRRSHRVSNESHRIHVEHWTIWRNKWTDKRPRVLGEHIQEEGRRWWDGVGHRAFHDCFITSHGSLIVFHGSFIVW